MKKGILWALVVLVLGVMVFIGVMLLGFYRDTRDEVEFEGSEAVLITVMPEQISRETVEDEIVKQNKEVYSSNGDCVSVGSFEFLGAQKTDDETILLYIVAMDEIYNRAGYVGGGIVPSVLTFVLQCWNSAGAKMSGNV